MPCRFTSSRFLSIPAPCSGNRLIYQGNWTSIASFCRRVGVGIEGRNWSLTHARQAWYWWRFVNFIMLVILKGKTRNTACELYILILQPGLCSVVSLTAWFCRVSDLESWPSPLSLGLPLVSAKTVIPLFLLTVPWTTPVCQSLQSLSGSDPMNPKWLSVLTSHLMRWVLLHIRDGCCSFDFPLPATPPRNVFFWTGERWAVRVQCTGKRYEGSACNLLGTLWAMISLSHCFKGG